MNASTIRWVCAGLVLNILICTRLGFNKIYLNPEILSQYKANGLFHLLPSPTQAWMFPTLAGVLFVLGAFFVWGYNRYLLILFFLCGSVVDNFQVNFPDGGHSGYLPYTALMVGMMGLFLNPKVNVFLGAYRSLIAAYYFVAGYYKLRASGWAWGLDESIFVHSVLLQETTPLKAYLLEYMPNVLKSGAYAMFLFEISAPLMIFCRWARWIYAPVFALFHLTLPFIWGGHGGFDVNAVCVILCLADEKWFQTVFSKFETAKAYLRGRIRV